jgi:hypothetical protein
MVNQNDVDLVVFFEFIKKHFGSVIVLRGYENMPQTFSNDIDIFVKKDKLSDFLALFRSHQQCDITVVDRRPGLTKTTVRFFGVEVAVDILTEFLYAGLKYQSATKLAKNPISHSSGLFSIPLPQQELRISLLKEILHNGRIRADKLSGFQSKDVNTYTLMESDYITRSDCETIYGFVKSGKTSIKDYSKAFRRRLLIINCRKSVFWTLVRFADFIVVKYVISRAK